MHLLRLGLVEHAGLLDVLVQIVVGQILRQHHLTEDVGVQIHGGLVGQQLFLHRRLLAGDPADAHARGHDLGKCAQHHALLAQEPVEAVPRLTGETQLAVGVVLQHHNVGALEHLGGLFAHLLGVGQTRGILEIGDDIDKLGVVLLHGFFQRRHVQTVPIQGDGQHLGVIQVEGLQSRQIAGGLHHDLVARVDHHGGEHVQRLLGAVGDDDVLRRKVQIHHLLIPLTDVAAQRLVALGAAVLQGADAALLEHLVRRLVHLADGEGHGVGQAAGKGDDAGVCGRPQDTGQKLGLKIGFGHSLGNFDLHRFILLFYCRFVGCAHTFL